MDFINLLSGDDFEMVFLLAAVALIVVIFSVRSYEAKQKAIYEKELQEKKEKERLRIEEENKKRIEEEEKKSARLKREQKEREIQLAIAQNPGSEQYRLETGQSECSSSLLSVTAFTPISKKRFVAFDLETTGLDHAGDRIIEIGAVRVENEKITAEFHQLIDPECHVPEAASQVNHITDDMLFGMPKIHEVLPAFLSFVGEDVLAAHNARFDGQFLHQVCLRNRFKVPERFFDTMNLAKYWPDAKNRKLSSLIAEAGIENDDAHRALSDAIAVARLIIATNEKRKAERRKSKTLQK